MRSNTPSGRKLFTSAVTWKKISWLTNFDKLTAAGLSVGTDYKAWIEVQAADDVDPDPPGVPATAEGLTPWTVINDGSATQTSVEWPGGPDPNLDGRRYFRWRWRFWVAETYPINTQPLPSIDSTTLEFER